MAKKNGLGRGLDALLPDVEGTLEQIDHRENPGERVAELPLSAIDPNRGQPRRLFDPQALQSLADSIRQSGVISPILTVRTGSRYTIIAGERRFRAAQLAGLETIPAIVRDWDEIHRQEAALIENMQRVDLNPIEEADGIRRLMETCGLTQEEAAARLGKSRSAVANILRLLSLPADIQSAVIDGRLSAGHARVLCALEEPQQMSLFRQTLLHDWSVRQLEEKAKENAKEPRQKPHTASFPAEYTTLMDTLREKTGLQVRLSGTPDKGRITLDYTTPDALQRLWDLLDKDGKL